MKIIFLPRFRRSHKRVVAKSEKLNFLAKERLLLFAKNPKTPLLKDHALVGKLKGYRAFSIGYDLRVIYRKEKNAYLFFDIGSHQEVYR